MNSPSYTDMLVDMNPPDPAEMAEEAAIITSNSILLDYEHALLAVEAVTRLQLYKIKLLAELES